MFFDALMVFEGLRLPVTALDAPRRPRVVEVCLGLLGGVGVRIGVFGDVEGC